MAFGICLGTAAYVTHQTLSASFIAESSNDSEYGPNTFFPNSPFTQKEKTSVHSTPDQGADPTSPNAKPSSAESNPQSEPQSSSQPQSSEQSAKQDNLNVDALVAEINQLKSLVQQLPAIKAENLLNLRKQLEAELEKDVQKKIELLEEEFEIELANLNEQLRVNVRHLNNAHRAEINAIGLAYDEKLLHLRQSYQERFEAEKALLVENFNLERDRRLAEIDAQLQAAFLTELEALQAQAAGLTKEATGRLQTLTAKVRRFAGQVELRSERVSLDGLQKMYLKFLDLKNQIDARVPFESQLGEFRKLSHSDPLLMSAINTIPSSVSQRGAYNLSHLQREFNELKLAARAQAFIPEGGSSLWKVWSFIMTHASFPVRGFVEGSDPDSVLSRAEFYLERGQVQESIEELERFSGSGKAVLREWVIHAKQYLYLNQSLSLIRARLANQMLNSFPNLGK